MVVWSQRAIERAAEQGIDLSKPRPQAQRKRAFRGVMCALRPMCGSNRKYAEMFGRVDGIDFSWGDVTPEQMRGYDFAVVAGDRHKQHRLALAAGIPYIVDEHDIHSLRTGRDHDDTEREMLENAAAIIFTSEAHRDWLAERYDLPPSVVVHLRPYLADLDFRARRKLAGKHIAYAGGVLPRFDADGPYGYRCYHDIFGALMDAGWTVHVYPAYGHDESTRVEYERLGVVWHERVEERDLPRELSAYRLGLMGYAEAGPQEYVKTCRPNKAWAYLSAGIPTLGYNTGDSGALFDGRWGLIAPSLAEIGETAERAAKMRIPDELRREQTMDADLPAFELLVDFARVAARHIGRGVR